MYLIKHITCVKHVFNMINIIHILHMYNTYVRHMCSFYKLNICAIFIYYTCVKHMCKNIYVIFHVDGRHLQSYEIMQYFFCKKKIKIIMVVAGTMLQANKVVLGAKCDVMSAMFGGSFVESLSCVWSQTTGYYVRLFFSPPWIPLFWPRPYWRGGLRGNYGVGGWILSEKTD